MTPETNASADRADHRRRTGNANVRRILAGVIRRQGMIGPIPASATTAIASGSTNGRKAERPDRYLRAGDRLGDQREEREPEDDRGQRHQDQVLQQEHPFPENRESSWASVRSASRRQITSRHRADHHHRDQRHERPCSSVGSDTKAWIELRIPERTRKSPTIASVPVSRISEAFHTFNIPRFSWIMIEWM